VPSTARIAVSLREHEDAEAREREEMKRLTLMANRCTCVKTVVRFDGHHLEAALNTVRLYRRHQEQEQAAIHRAQMRGIPPPQPSSAGSTQGSQQQRSQGGYHGANALGLDHAVPHGLRPDSGRKQSGRPKN
jgi:hypothetical protein